MTSLLLYVGELVGRAAKEIGKVSTRCYYVMGAAPSSYMRQLFLMGTAEIEKI